MANVPVEGKSGGTPWWMWLLAVLAIIGLIWLIATLFDGDPAVGDRVDPVGVYDISEGEMTEQLRPRVLSDRLYLDARRVTSGLASVRLPQGPALGAFPFEPIT